MPLAHTRDPAVGAARSLSGVGTTQSTNYSLPDGLDWVSVQLNLTAIAGTGATLDVTVQWSMDGGVTWSSADASATDAFTQFTLAGGAKAVVKRFNVKAPMVRFNEALAGTSPTATYTPTIYYRQSSVAVFTPPLRTSVPAVNADTPSWQRKPAIWFAQSALIPRGVNVFKLLDGTYTEVQPTDYTQIAVWYMGGHSWDVTVVEADNLNHAGYGANITGRSDVYTGTYFGSY